MSSVPIRIDVLAGAAALSAITDRGFLAEWVQLWDSCPWATAFQGPAFVSTWYSHYSDTHRPLLFVGRDSTDRLVGLLALAAELTGDRSLIAAGGWQAEYQCWICEAQLVSLFMNQVLRRIADEGTHMTLELRYLPHDAPRAFLSDLPSGVRHQLQARRDPVVDLVERDRLERMLKGKSVRNQLNRLSRVGAVRFERVFDTEPALELLPELAVFCDFRNGALRGVEPFRSDARKMGFWKAMLRNHDCCHLSVLRVGDEICAAHLGIASRSTLHLGIMGFNPAFAQFSPGKLLNGYLAIGLASEGFITMDLTPGADSYKEHLATTSREAAEVTFYFTALPYVLSTGKQRLKLRMKQFIDGLGVRPDSVRAMARIGYDTSLDALRRIRSRVRRGLREETVELRAYSLEFPMRVALEPSPNVKVNSLASLLEYQPVRGLCSRQEFLKDSLARIEAGEIAFTVAENGRLVHWGWLVRQQSVSSLCEVGVDLVLPDASATLYDFFTCPSARGRGLYKDSMRTMLARLESERATARAFIFVLSDNISSIRAIEKLGFNLVGSLFRSDRAASTRRWTTGLAGLSWSVTNSR